MKEVQASDSVAEEILIFTRKRLNKFDKPKLYKEPGFAQIGIIDTSPSPPETAGADRKKSESGKVLLA